MAGVDLVHVPYRGGGPVMTDLLGGQVQVLFGSTSLTIEQITALNPSVIQDYLEMEQRWLALARSYGFTERLSTFVEPFRRQAREDRESLPRGVHKVWITKQAARPGCARSGHCCGARAHRGGQGHGAIEAAARAREPVSMDVLEREREHLAEADGHIPAAKQQVESRASCSVANLPMVAPLISTATKRPPPLRETAGQRWLRRSGATLRSFHWPRHPFV